MIQKLKLKNPSKILKILKGFDSHQSQKTNKDGIQDEVPEKPAEILLVSKSRPKSLVTKIQVVLSLNLNKNNHSKTQVTAINSNSLQPQKKFQKIIKYPEKCEEWTIEDCQREMEEDPNDIFPEFRLAIISTDDQLEKTKEYLLKVTEIDPLFEVEKVNWALGTIFVSEKEWKSFTSFSYRLSLQLRQSKILLRDSQMLLKIKGI